MECSYQTKYRLYLPPGAQEVERAMFSLIYGRGGENARSPEIHFLAGVEIKHQSNSTSERSRLFLGLVAAFSEGALALVFRERDRSDALCDGR